MHEALSVAHHKDLHRPPFASCQRHCSAAWTCRLMGPTGLKLASATMTRTFTFEAFGWSHLENDLESGGLQGRGWPCVNHCTSLFYHLKLSLLSGIMRGEEVSHNSQKWNHFASLRWANQPWSGSANTVKHVTEAWLMNMPIRLWDELELSFKGSWWRKDKGLFNSGL